MMPECSKVVILYLAMYASLRALNCYNVKPGGNYVPTAVTLHLVGFLCRAFLNRKPIISLSNFDWLLYWRIGVHCEVGSSIMKPT
jgi:hypothetical protein